MIRTTTTTVAALALVAVAFAFPTASADHSSVACPEYSDGVAVDDYTGFWFNERGQFLVGVVGVYFSHDETASNDYLFAWGIYAESNGEPGLQRHDEYCESAGWDGPTDTAPCWSEPRTAC